MKTRIELARPSEQTRLLLDGKDVASLVQSLTLTADCREYVLTLNVPLHETVVDGEMRVEIPDSTRDLLLTLGWTPPTEGIAR